MIIALVQLIYIGVYCEGYQGGKERGHLFQTWYPVHSSTISCLRKNEKSSEIFDTSISVVEISFDSVLIRRLKIVDDYSAS